MGSVVKGIGNAVKGVVKGVGKVFKSVGKAIGKVAKNIGKAIGKAGPLLGILGMVLMPYLAPALSSAWGTFSTFAAGQTGITGAFLQGVAAIGNGIGAAYNAIGAVTKGVFGTIGEGIDKVFTSIGFEKGPVAGMQSLWNTATGAVNSGTTMTGNELVQAAQINTQTLGAELGGTGTGFSGADPFNLGAGTSSSPGFVGPGSIMEAGAANTGSVSSLSTGNFVGPGVQSFMGPDIATSSNYSIQGGDPNAFVNPLGRTDVTQSGITSSQSAISARELTQAGQGISWRDVVKAGAKAFGAGMGLGGSQATQVSMPSPDLSSNVMGPMGMGGSAGVGSTVWSPWGADENYMNTLKQHALQYQQYLQGLGTRTA